MPNFYEHKTQTTCTQYGFILEFYATKLYLDYGLLRNFNTK